jgi:hypothetical protein
MPRVNRLLVKPERQATSINQRLVILAPVVDVILCFLQLLAHSLNLLATYRVCGGEAHGKFVLPVKSVKPGKNSESF